MKNISSYSDIEKRRKEISLQKKILWNEISTLHNDESENKGLIKRVLTTNPSIIIGIWSFVNRVFRAVKRKSKEKS
jgi:hypothetical protein